MHVIAFISYVNCFYGFTCTLKFSYSAVGGADRLLKYKND